MIRAQERQAIFAEAFESEIQQYKQSGIIPSRLFILILISVNKLDFFLSYSRKKYLATGNIKLRRSRRGRRSVQSEWIPRRLLIRNIYIRLSLLILNTSYIVLYNAVIYFSCFTSKKTNEKQHITSDGRWWEKEQPIRRQLCMWDNNERLYWWTP